MTKTYQIAELTNGGFEIVARNLTWMDACNQSMTLNVNVDAADFREVPMTVSSRGELRAWENRATNNSCPVQADWAYL